MARLAGISVMAAGFVTVISSSFAFMTPIASPACQIVYATGHLRKWDFLRGGWKMVLVSLGLLLLFSQTYWRLVGLPR
jgi:di/tricarboxylate transporter